MNHASTAWSAGVTSRSAGRIAVVANESDLPLVLMDADGKHRHVVGRWQTRHPGPPTAGRSPSRTLWSPDRREVAFIGGPGDWSLVRIRLDGSARQAVFAKRADWVKRDLTPKPVDLCL